MVRNIQIQLDKGTFFLNIINPKRRILDEEDPDPDPDPDLDLDPHF